MAPIPLLEPTEFLIQTINGVQSGLVLFLIASGLTVILGILDVLNLAHGSLYALGAYIASSVVGWLVAQVIANPPSAFEPVTSLLLVGVLVVGALLAAAIMLPIGAVLERVFIARVYDRDQVYQLVLTFALLLMIEDAILFIWGSSSQSLPFDYTIAVNAIPTFGPLGLPSVPTKVMFIIIVAAILGGLLFWFFAKTKTGRIIRATAIDREMAQALGVSPARTFTVVFAFGAFLAGFAGGMQMIKTSASAGMGASALVLSFVVIVVGGLGSLRGAFWGALLVGVLSTWMQVMGTWMRSNYAISLPLETAAPFLVMILVLLVRPEGLFGAWGERT